MHRGEPDREEPLTVTFEVDCPVEHAFAVWTERIGAWWPRDHTVSGRPDVEVVLEPRLGGRIFERAGDGAEHQWGQITLWEPPFRLSYQWHLQRPPVDATAVDIHFVARPDATTQVRIEHRGWDEQAPGGDPWRERNRLGWQSVVPHYQRAIRTGGR